MWDSEDQKMKHLHTMFAPGAYRDSGTRTSADYNFQISEREILMQFTGLTDRTGKEIYEGDIVEYAEKRKICPDCAKKECSSELTYGISKFCPECGKHLTDADFIERVKVVFEDGGFAYCKIVDEDYYQSWHVQIAAIYIEWVQVIGNLFENPELINA
jgi:uncharacterized phage protein (TIGR01671 family)